MKQILFEADINPLLRIEITKEHGSNEAILRIESDAKIERAIKEFAHNGPINTDPAQTADRLFGDVVHRLREQDFRCENLATENLPKMERDATGFWATATIDVDNKSDTELRATFEREIHPVVRRIADSFFGKVGWTDKIAGNRAGRGPSS